MQGVLVFPGCQFCLFDIVAVGFVDDDGVCHFHDASLYSLQFIPGPCNLYQQEKVNHRMNHRFGLANADSFYQDGVKTCCFAEQDGFARLACHAPERTGRRTWPDIGIRIGGELFHPGLVT